MANVGQGPDAIKGIESAIQQAMGDFGSPDLSGGIFKGTMFQSNQAKAAGRIYMNNFMTEAIAAANTNEDLVQKALAQAFTPTNVEIDEYNPMGEREVHLLLLPEGLTDVRYNKVLIEQQK